MEQLKTVVVGYGYAGRCFHAYLVGLEPALELYGVVSSRPQARQQIRAELDVRAMTHVDEALTDEAVDLVVLATPNDTHADLAVAALEAGKHVVTDKPMCLDTAEADRMIAARDRAGRTLSIFQNRRWDGDYLTVRNVLDEGLIGDLFSLEMAWQKYEQPRSWRGQRRHGGGRFMDLGSHMIDQALMLVDAPVQQVYARFFGDVWDTDVEDHAHCAITFTNGVEADVVSSSLARISKPRWYVLGTKGTLVKEGLDPQEKAMVAGDIDAAQPERARVSTEIDGVLSDALIETAPGRWRAYYENVAAAILGCSELAVTAESVRQVMEVIDAARLSAATGETVRFGDSAKGDSGN